MISYVEIPDLSWTVLLARHQQTLKLVYAMACEIEKDEPAYGYMVVYGAREEFD